MVPHDNSDYNSLDYHFVCKPSANFADNVETVSPGSSNTTDNGVILPSEPEKMINLRDKPSRLNGSGGNRGDTAAETQSPQSTVTYIPGEGDYYHCSSAKHVHMANRRV